MKVVTAPFTITETFDNARFEIKALTSGDVYRIVDASVSRKMEIGADKTIKHVSTVTPERERRQQAIAAIVSWGPVLDELGNEIPGSGVNDANGVPIPLSPVAVETLLEHVPGFPPFIAQSIDKAHKAKIMLEESLAKNS